MLKKIVTLSLFAFTLQADMIGFYSSALKNLEYNKNYTLYEKANQTSQSAITYSKYANFSADAAYTKTYAKLLPSSSGNFGATDIAFHDTIDIFGKNDYKIKTLRLDTEMKKSRLKLKKEQLFTALADMVSLYNQTTAQLKIRQEFYNKENRIYKKLEALEKNGDVTEFELLRFKNTLTTLKTSMISMKQELTKMKMQLNLYAPKETIPTLTHTKLLYTKKDFLLHNPQVTINKLDSQKLLSQAKGLSNSYIPTIDVSAAYQKLDDPTSYGDNHSFGASLHIPLNGGDFKEVEALKVSALTKETKNREYKIQREQEYIRHYQEYQNAKKQLEILERSQQDFEKSEDTIQKAYLKRYVDFNTYLQVLQQTLNVKNQIIVMKNKEQLEATIINTISSGKVYE